jgi:hypothetical protein
MRQFIRHPVDIPLEYEVGAAAKPRDDLALNISLGGLAFRSEEPISEGVEIAIRFPLITRDQVIKGYVVWSKKNNNHFETGVKFADPQTTFRARMIEQLCHIELFRRRASAENGRELSGEEAAREWISRFAGRFPSV